VCVCRPHTADAIRARGLELVAPEQTVVTWPEAVEQLEHPVSLLVVAVKAYALAEALERIEAFAVADGIVLPLLNGLEHPDMIRRRLGPRVAPAAISRFSGELVAPGRIVQRSAGAVITAAPGDLTRTALEVGVEPLRDAGFEVTVAGDERAVLWGKAARLAVLAAATSAGGCSVGELRGDREWRARLAAALEETCAAAAADGVPLQPTDQWAIIDAMPHEATTSTALDIARNHPSELDAISGSVLRAAHRLGVATPVLAGLLAEAARA
jgi:2-dehydropantoate 2-reductase